MLNELVHNKIYYKIFDRTYIHSTHIYAKHRYSDEAKISEIHNNIKSVTSEFSDRATLLLLKQVHSSIIIDADAITDFNIQPEGDGSFTTKTNIILGIQTADCVPVLLYSENPYVIGTVHCGWQGAKRDIISNLVNAMQSKVSSTQLMINAIIGPCIRQDSYEVSKDYYDSFINENKNYDQFFIRSVNFDYFMFDLSLFVKYKLNNAGITNIMDMQDDTYTMPEKYSSYRRQVHFGALYNQSILSVIMMK